MLLSALRQQFHLANSKSACRGFLLVAFIAAISLSAQQPASVPEVTGKVSGHVTCSDTGKPARFASIQLLSEQSAKKPMLDPSALADMTGSGDAKGASGNKIDFGSLIAKGMAAVMQGSNLSTTTAMDGSFSLDNVPPGTYYIIPQLAGYLSPIGQFSQAERMQASDATLAVIKSAAQKIEVGPDAAINIDVQLDRGAAIGGSIRYDDGSPAPGVTATLMSLGKDGKWKDLPSPSMLPSATDDRGHYRFAGLPAGQYAVRAALPSFQTSMGIGAGSLAMHMKMGDALEIYSGSAVWKKDVKPIELSAGDNRDDVDITFPITGLHTVSGNVVAKSDGHPVNFGSIELQDPADRTVTLRTTMIGKDGGFQFNYVPDGSYRLHVSGAADVEAPPGAASDNPLSMIMGGKIPQPTREYGPAGINLLLPGNSEGISLEVPDAVKSSK